MTDEEKVEFLINQLQTLSEKISYLRGEIYELEVYMDDCMKELEKLGVYEHE